MEIPRLNGVIWPHGNAKNVEPPMSQGFRWLMPAPVPSFAALELGRRTSGRGYPRFRPLARGFGGAPGMSPARIRACTNAFSTSLIRV